MAKPPTAARQPSGQIQSGRTHPAVKYYLFAYNTLSAIGWGFILLKLCLHLAGRDLGSGSVLTAAKPPSSSSSAHTALSTLSAFLSSLRVPRIPYLSDPPPLASQLHGKLGPGNIQMPKALQLFLKRATTSYGVVGPLTAAVQSAAALEVLHAFLGWVRSPLQTTAMQVASRLFLIWGVTERYEVGRTTPLYSSMVLAWSLTEVIRYAFYACSLLPISNSASSNTGNSYVPYWLLYLRYTTFYVLYPLGAGSEALVNLQTLPSGSPIPTLSGWLGGDAVWTPYDWARGVLFLIWWPGLYVMYTYMMSQRRKVLGKGRTLGSKPKSL